MLLHALLATVAVASPAPVATPTPDFKANVVFRLPESEGRVRLSGVVIRRGDRFEYQIVGTEGYLWWTRKMSKAAKVDLKSHEANCTFINADSRYEFKYGVNADKTPISRMSVDPLSFTAIAFLGNRLARETTFGGETIFDGQPVESYAFHEPDGVSGTILYSRALGFPLKVTARNIEKGWVQSVEFKDVTLEPSLP